MALMRMKETLNILVISNKKKKQIFDLIRFSKYDTFQYFMI
jgi:hypothetical protein